MIPREVDCVGRGTLEQLDVAGRMAMGPGPCFWPAHGLHQMAVHALWLVYIM